MHLLTEFAQPTTRTTRNRIASPRYSSWHGHCSTLCAMRVWSLFFLAASVIAPVTVAAQDAASPPSVDALVAEVIERNPSVRARSLRRDALGGEARAAGIYPDPQIAVMVDRVPQANEAAEMPMVRYQATQMFPWPGKLPLMRTAVERQRDAAGADVDVRRLDLRLEAKRAYFMLALNAKRREINRASRSLAVTIAQATLGRYSTGVGGHHDVVRAQVEVNALDVEITNLEGERLVTIAMINSLRDRAADVAFPDPPLVSTPATDATLASLTERANAQRPELKGMRAMQSEAIAMGDLARRERYPDVMGSVWVNQNIGAPASAGGMVGVTIPVFGLARQGYRAGAFDARAQGAAEDAASMRAMIRFEVADALVRVQTTSRRLELVDTVVLPKARESFESSLAGYGAGTVDLIGLLDARRSLQTSSLMLAEARVEREVAIAELERAVGRPTNGATR
jgi:outer membrane protein TolC